MAADAVDEAQLRELIPGVLAALVHRGADFATAEDAVQKALVRAVETWPNQRPDDAKGWLITTAWRRFVDLARSDTARRNRENRVSDEPPPGPAASTDDTLQLYFLCAHPSLTPASAVALTLRADGSLVPLSDQDRGLWRRDLIAEGVVVLQAALARDRLGEYQAQAAIAALHADAQTADETDWVQIVEWYDELVALTDSPIVRLNRAVAVGEADRPQAGIAALGELDPMLPRYTASVAYLHERAGDIATAAELYAEAASQAQTLAERNHLTLRAATLRHRLPGEGG
ncbi:MAG: sigma factor [Mycobacterium sp.]